MSDTESRVAIVTGAGSGIGRAVAKQLLRAGWRVVGVGRTLDKLESTAEQSGCADRFTTHVCDLADTAACDALVDETADTLGSIDALVNIAGHAELATIAQTTPELFRKTIDANLTAVVQLTHACWPTFARQHTAGGGREDSADGSGGGAIVVNVSSMASIDPFPGFAAYAAAKAGVNLFTLVTAREGAAIGLRAVAVAPGAVETPLLRSMFDTQTIAPTDTLAPAEVAAVIVACIDGERDFEPGETIAVVSDTTE